MVSGHSVNPFDFHGYRVVVAGASRGIGRSIALGFAEAGAAVSICARGEAALEQTRQAIVACGVIAHARSCDLADPQAIDAYVAEAASALGGIDVLVNTVGGLRSKRLYTPLLEMAEEQWRATFDLNLMGGFHLIRAFAPGMIERGAGRIVNFASIVFGGEHGQADYAAAKAAVASLTRSLAAELAPSVTVNAVAPGLTRTSVTQNMPPEEAARLVGGAFHHRMAEPGEIAEAVAFFASEPARFITGEIMAVSGGIHPHL